MSPMPAPRKITPSLDVLPFPPPRAENEGTPCPHCGSSLTLVQPDQELADRLIGACRRCKHWFLIDTLPDSREGIMVRLPDEQVIRSLSQGNPSQGISVMDGGRDDDPKGQTGAP